MAMTVALIDRHPVFPELNAMSLACDDLSRRVNPSLAV
jgi:hypothetical protein